ncbi:Uncharacterised protein [Enterococcus malodoratus]|uniref:Uncharacterized protein n=1 Tax=Enterococcus malodoratus ATCC 43197 TaxID=1158601 RepID=R2P522_9ENTE|nr:hypothetical protein UAI_01365 [Enterococcus malodoratus ATCC 43197]EOT64854.1 hypothetical protein I585_04055 [Enterococcus malodoratus ATCC 43197]STC72239.1 Uncharacterised protein [Enterococcus malodoratus]
MLSEIIILQSKGEKSMTIGEKQFYEYKKYRKSPS